jgi:hypothetical protein
VEAPFDRSSRRESKAFSNECDLCRSGPAGGAASTGRAGRVGGPPDGVGDVGEAAETVSRSRPPVLVVSCVTVSVLRVVRFGLPGGAAAGSQAPGRRPLRMPALASGPGSPESRAPAGSSSSTSPRRLRRQPACPGTAAVKRDGDGKNPGADASDRGTGLAADDGPLLTGWQGRCGAYRSPSARSTRVRNIAGPPDSRTPSTGPAAASGTHRCDDSGATARRPWSDGSAGTGRPHLLRGAGSS